MNILYINLRNDWREVIWSNFTLKLEFCKEVFSINEFVLYKSHEQNYCTALVVVKDHTAA